MQVIESPGRSGAAIENNCLTKIKFTNVPCYTDEIFLLFMCVFDLGCWTLIAVGRTILITLVRHKRHLWKSMFGLKHWFVFCCSHWLVTVSLSYVRSMLSHVLAVLLCPDVWNVDDLLEWSFIIILFKKQIVACLCMPGLSLLRYFSIVPIDRFKENS